jgi:hypothetical protein
MALAHTDTTSICFADHAPYCRTIPQSSKRSSRRLQSMRGASDDLKRTLTTKRLHHAIPKREGVKLHTSTSTSAAVLGYINPILYHGRQHHPSRLSPARRLAPSAVVVLTTAVSRLSSHQPSAWTALHSSYSQPQVKTRPPHPDVVPNKGSRLPKSALPNNGTCQMQVRDQLADRHWRDS